MLRGMGFEIMHHSGVHKGINICYQLDFITKLIASLETSMSL